MTGTSAFLRSFLLTQQPLRFSPNGTYLCQPRPTAWETPPHTTRAPTGRPEHLFKSSTVEAANGESFRRIGPESIIIHRTAPLGLFIFRHERTQAVGLGCHRIATLWRKQSVTGTSHLSALVQGICPEKDSSILHDSAWYLLLCDLRLCNTTENR